MRGGDRSGRRAVMSIDINQSKGQNSCRRCGTCCRQGGPALHMEDRALVEGGAIRLTELVTLRQGEPARDNVSGGIIAAESDIIKIKSRARTTACRFFDDPENTCHIYTRRPLECRVLKCWDTREIRDLYHRDRLTRQMLLEGRHGLWDLVAEHQQTCDYSRIGDLVRQADRQQLAYLLRYDANIRRLVVEKTGLDQEVLPFLLGQPLSVTIERYGLRSRDLAAG